MISHLDYREKGGFTRSKTLFFPKDSKVEPFEIIVYVAVEGNVNYLGKITLLREGFIQPILRFVRFRIETSRQIIFPVFSHGILFRFVRTISLGEKLSHMCLFERDDNIYNRLPSDSMKFTILNIQLK